MARFPIEIDTTGSILFLGSGFAAEATNIRKLKLPAGDGLKLQLAKAIEVDPQSYDLKTIADEFASRPNLGLYQTLYETFTVKELSSEQESLLSFPWRRIYTTNYDDAAETYFQKRNRDVPSFSYDEAKPKRLLPGTIIHLHGIIRRATRENILTQLVLNESSYIRQHFEKSPWYDDFDRDLRYCANCFFVGYSLSDYHIAALLMKNPAVKEKTYFVTRTKDAIFENRTKDYGYSIPVGLGGLVAHLKTAPKPAPSANPYDLKAFNYIDPFKDKKALAQPTANEVINLVTYGTFNFLRCLSTLPDSTYVVPRTERVDEAIENFGPTKTLIVHSWLGNGKSIFSYILAAKLAEKDYRCFQYKGDGPILQADIELLKKIDRIAIVFDSYNSAIDVIDQFGDLPAATKYIVCVRTGIQEVRLHEIQARLPAPQYRLNLNGLSRFEKRDFTALLDGAGVRVPNLEDIINRCKDFREVVVSLYDNELIKEKIKAELAPLMKDTGFRKVFVASHLVKWIGQEVPISFLRAVTGRDAYAEMAKHREITSDIFNLDEDSLRVRSATFSEYIIQNHFASEDILGLVYDIIIEAVKRKKDRRFQHVLSSLMQVSNLKRALRFDADRHGALIGLFERLRRDIEVNQEPLFWLQYTILMIDGNELEPAERFLETAYDRAAASPGFQTYQIDTQALRLVLLLETQTKGTSVSRFDNFSEKTGLVLSMLADDSHRSYAVRVLEGMHKFVSTRLLDFTTPEKNVLVLLLNRLVDSLEHLSVDAKAQTGSEQVKQSLLAAKDLILSAGKTSRGY